MNNNNIGTRLLCALILAAAVITMMVTSVASPVHALQPQHYEFVSNGLADPMRTVSYYMFDAAPGTADNNRVAVGKVYLFRNGGATPSSPAVPESVQPPIVSTTADVLRVHIVQIPDGTLPSLLFKRFSEVEFPPIGVKVHETNFYAVMPKNVSSFRYANVADHTTRFPVKRVFLGEDGSNSSVIDFGLYEVGVDMGAVQASASQQQSMKTAGMYAQHELGGTGALLGYLLDSVPGDVGFSPVRRMTNVSVASLYPSSRTMAADNVVEIVTTKYVLVVVTNVVGADNMPLGGGANIVRTGFAFSEEVRFLALNSSRMGSLTTSPRTGMRPARLVVVPGQSIPILQHAPGHTGGYSDLLAVYDVSFAQGTVPAGPGGVVYDSYTRLPANATLTFTGRYINCPVLNPYTTFMSTRSTDSIGQKQMVYYNGIQKACFNFSSVESGCVIRAAYELRRANDKTLVEENDIFATSPFDSSLQASPFVWKFPHIVEQLYRTGSFKSVDALVVGTNTAVTPITSASYALGEFFNSPIVSRRTAPAPGFLFPKIGQTSSRQAGLSNWTLRYWAPGETKWAQENQVCFELTAQFGHGVVAIGFGRSSTPIASEIASAAASSSAGGGVSVQHSISSVFVVGHFSGASGRPCVRTIYKSPATGAFVDGDGPSLLNVTTASFTLSDPDTNAVKLSFCRNRAPRTSDLPNSTVGLLELASLERIEVASGPIRKVESSATSSSSSSSSSSTSATLNAMDYSTLPKTCSSGIDSSLWATARRFHIDWTRYLPPLATPPLLTIPPVSSAPPVTTPSPTVNRVANKYNGSYRLDETKIFSWRTLPVDSTTPSQVEVFLTFPSSFYGWIALGFGAPTWVASDILFVVRSMSLLDPPYTNRIMYDDRKGITQTLWRRDSQQDWVLGDASAVDRTIPPLVDANPNNVHTLAFIRNLDTFDRSISTQSVSTTTALQVQMHTRIRGWGGIGGGVASSSLPSVTSTGIAVEFYAFGNTPAFSTASNETASNVYCRMVAAGTGLQHAWQRDIISAAPGQEGYSDLWRVTTIYVPDSFVGPELMDVSDIPATWTRIAAPSATADPAARPNDWKNCPVIHDLATIDSSEGMTKVRTVWYRGTRVRCVEFLQRFNAAKRTTQKAVRVVQRGGSTTTTTTTTLDWIFEYAPVTSAAFNNYTQAQTAPVQPSYSPFVVLYTAEVPAGAIYNAGTYRDFNEFVAASQLVMSLTDVQYVNLPCILPGAPVLAGDGTPASPPGSGGNSSPSPVSSGEFPQSLTQNYARRATLEAKGAVKIDLLWTVEPSLRKLKVLILGYNVWGWLAIGFSSDPHLKMAKSDIVLGVRGASLVTPCIKVLYSDSFESAPSGDPTLNIQAPNLGTEGNTGMWMSFERHYDGNAHPEGKIPDWPAQPISRIIWGSLDTPTSVVTSCAGNLPYSALYHGASPHGVAKMNWNTGLLSSSTPSPPATPAPAAVARRVSFQPFSMSRQVIKFRGFNVPAYCAPSIYSDQLPYIPVQDWTPLFPAERTAANAPNASDLTVETFDEVFGLGGDRPPSMIFFFAAYANDGARLTQLQLPLINDQFAGARRYTGIFRAIFVTVNTMGLNSSEYVWPTSVRSMAAARALFAAANFSRIAASPPPPSHHTLVWLHTVNGNVLIDHRNNTALLESGRVSQATQKALGMDLRRWINCPAVHASTTVAEPETDTALFRKINIYSAGAPFVCMFFGNGYAKEVPTAQSYSPPLVGMSGMSSANNATLVFQEVWNVTETALAQSLAATLPLVVDSLRFPLYRVSPRRQLNSDALNSAEHIMSKTSPANTGISLDGVENATAGIMNCVPLLDYTLKRTIRYSRPPDASVTVQRGYFHGRQAYHVSIEPAYRSANQREVDVGVFYVMLRGGTEIGVHPRAADHPAFVSPNFPGTMTETAIFQLVGVDVGTRNSTALGPIKYVDSVQQLPKQVSSTFVQCTFVPENNLIGAPGGSGGSGATIPMQQVYVDGQLFVCASYGVTRWPPPSPSLTQTARSSSPSSSSASSSASGAPVLPSFYELYSVSGNLQALNTIFQSVPGRHDFFGLQFSLRVDMLIDPSTYPTSIQRLNELSFRLSVPFKVMSVFISEVDSAVITDVESQVPIRELVQITSPITGAPILMRNDVADPTVLLAAPVEFDVERALTADQILSSSSSNAVFPIANVSTFSPEQLAQALPVVYFFRRGPSLDSAVVEVQAPVVTRLPSDATYKYTKGTEGYADLFRITVVVLPLNVSLTVLKTSAAVSSAIETVAGVYAVPTTTLAALFVAAKSPNSTVDTTRIFSSAAFMGRQEQTCAAIKVWALGGQIASLLCGYHASKKVPASSSSSVRETTTRSTDSMTSSTFVVANPSARGWSFRVAARLDVANPFLQEDFSLRSVTPVFLAKHLVKASIVGAAQSINSTLPPVVGKKYVFRVGPHLQGSDKVTAAGMLPVVDRAAPPGIYGANTNLRAQAFELVVVNVESSLWKKTNLSMTDADVLAAIAATVLRPADIWARAEAECWVIRPTGILEVGVLVSTTMALPTQMFGTRSEPVHADGIKLNHFILSEALRQNVDLVERQYIVGVFSGQTLLSFLLPVLPDVSTSSARDLVSLYRLLKVDLDELDAAKVSKSAVAAAQSVEDLAALFSVTATTVPAESTDISAPSTATQSYIRFSDLDAGLLRNAMLTNVSAMRNNISLWTTIHATQVAARPFVSAAVLAKSYVRDQFFQGGTATLAYRFHEVSGGVTTPVPVYFFLRRNSFGTIFTTAAMPILVHLPGDPLYTDVHERIECLVADAFSTWQPHSAADVADALQEGVVTGCTSVGYFGYVVMNTSSTGAEAADMYSLGNTGGFTAEVLVMHDGSVYKLLATGPLTPADAYASPSVASLPTVADLYNGITRVQRGSVLSAAPAKSGSQYRVCKAVAAGASTLLLAAEYKSYADILAAAGQGNLTLTCTNNVAFIVLAPDVRSSASGSGSTLYDDFVFGAADMTVNWAFGNLLAGPPLQLQFPPAVEGTMNVNLISGKTDEATLGSTSVLGPRHLLFGGKVDFSWTLTTTPPPTGSVTTEAPPLLSPPGAATTTTTNAAVFSSSSSSAEKRWGDFPSVPASETYVDFSFKPRTDVWVGIALVNSGVSAADVYIAYIGQRSVSGVSIGLPDSASSSVRVQFEKEGFYPSKTFVVHPNLRTRTTTTSVVNGTATGAATNISPRWYTLRNVVYRGNSSSSTFTSAGTHFMWETTTTRPLNAPSTAPDNQTIVPLGNGKVTLLWAVGSWDYIKNQPGSVSERGVHVIDFVRDDWLRTARGLPPAWVIITVFVLATVWVLIAIFTRKVVGARLLFSHPLISCSTQSSDSLRDASGLVWYFAGASLGNLLSMFWFLVILAVWSGGATLDAQEWRSTQASVIALFRALQFCFYFLLLPLPRHNAIFHYIFGVATNRGQMWQLGIIFVTMVVACAWAVVAPLTNMMSDTLEIACSSVIALLLVYWYLLEMAAGRSNSTTFFPICMTRRASRQFQRAVIVVGLLVCIHLIEWTTIYGMLVSLLLLLADIALYLRDLRQRSAYVRSGRVFPHDQRATVAVELMILSNPRPEHTCDQGLFSVARPGAFCMVQFDDLGAGTAVPLVLGCSAQEEDVPFANTAVHVRCSEMDVANAMAQGSNIRAEDSRTAQELLLRCADDGTLEQRSVSVFGPYGGMQHNLQAYSTLVLVAGGGGIVSAMSVLENLCKHPDLSRTTSVRMVELIWVMRDAHEIEAWRYEIESVLAIVRPFQVRFSFYTTTIPKTIAAQQRSSSRNTSQQQQQGGDFDGIYGGSEGEEMQPVKNNNNNSLVTTPDRHKRVRLAPSSASSSAVPLEKRSIANKYKASALYDEDDDGTEQGEAADAAEDRGYSPSTIASSSSSPGTKVGPYNGARNYANMKAPDNLSAMVDIENPEDIAAKLSDAEAAWVEVADLYRGRPVWEEVLHQIKIDASTRGEEGVAVFVSAPRSMSRHVVIASELASTWSGTSLHVEVEKFDEW